MSKLPIKQLKIIWKGKTPPPPDCTNAYNDFVSISSEFGQITGMVSWNVTKRHYEFQIMIHEKDGSFNLVKRVDLQPKRYNLIKTVIETVYGVEHFPNMFKKQPVREVTVPESLVSILKVTTIKKQNGRSST